MRHRLSSAIVLVVLVTACGSTSVVSDAPGNHAAREAADGAAVASGRTSESDGTTTTALPTEAPDLAYFIAAVNDGLVGTTYAEAPVADPEVFIGVGQLFCELLAEGLTVDEVLTAYLTALEDPEGVVTEDDALVSGLVMGASLEVICPELADRA